MPKEPTPEEAVPPGTVLLGRYRIDSILGKGGMGMVAAATHLGLEEKVAIKLLRPDVIADAETCSRFLREAQAAVKLKSEHVARVTDVGTLATGSPYMVMELLEGLDLDQMLGASGPVSPGLAVDFVLQACEALAEAHALGIVHRDVKPSNFFVTWRDDGSALVKVLDFGISKAPIGIDLALTQTQSVLGTPAYMSPEQMRSARRVDARTDLWSIGTVLYELIEGRRPFVAESFSEMCVKVAADPPEPIGAPIPAGLDAVIFKCLEKSPDLRYQTIAELAEALAPYARDPRDAAVRVARIRRTLATAKPASRDSQPSLSRAATPPPALEDVEPVRFDTRPSPAPAAVSAAHPVRSGRRIGVIAGVAVLVVTAGIAVAVVAGRGAPAAAPDAAPAAAPGPAPDAGTAAAVAEPGPAPEAEPEAEPEPEAAPEPDPEIEIADPEPSPRARPKKKRAKKPRRGEARDDVFGKRK